MNFPINSYSKFYFYFIIFLKLYLWIHISKAPQVIVSLLLDSVRLFAATSHSMSKLVGRPFKTENFTQFFKLFGGAGKRVDIIVNSIYYGSRLGPFTLKIIVFTAVRSQLFHFLKIHYFFIFSNNQIKIVPFK